MPYEVFGIRLQAASLEDIIASKQASNRAKDRAHLDVLRELRDELEAQRREGNREHEVEEFGFEL